MNKTQFHIEHIGPEISYPNALIKQETAVEKVLNAPEGENRPILFFAEHAPIFTCGTSAEEKDLLNTGDIPIIKSGRGGQITYHGPGQQIIYPIINLKNHKQDLRWYVRTLQEWIVAVLAEYGIEGKITDDVGVWVATEHGDEKIAAIGIRVRKWVTFHGLALNVNPDLSAYQRIVPCGIANKGVTSMQEILGTAPTLQEIEQHFLAKNPF